MNMDKSPHPYYQKAETMRNERMAWLYKSGCTLQQIGDEYGLTRERVRQILAKEGLNRTHGGAKIAAIQRHDRRRLRAKLKRDQVSMKIYGCPHDEVLALNDRKIVSDPTGPAYQFLHKMSHEKLLGNEWELSFPEWRIVWMDSGKAEDIGREKGAYGMFRVDLTKPWAIGNVQIMEFGEGIQMVRQREKDNSPG